VMSEKTLGKRDVTTRITEDVEASVPVVPRLGMFKTMTITFGDQAENHVGMQKLGNGLAKEGFTVEELELIKQDVEGKADWKCELVHLNDAIKDLKDIQADPAAVLIIRNGLQYLADNKFTNEELSTELGSLEWDTKAKMYGRIVNKNARYNLCFAEFEQAADYENGKGTVVSYEKLPCLSRIREEIGKFGEKSESLFAEGNLYYNTSKCGIGYHGDSERKIVVAFRLGATLPLHYHWFHQGKAIGNTVQLSFGQGDVYIMSEKATGFDWKRKKIPTLRHAAGCSKFTTLPTPRPKRK